MDARRASLVVLLAVCAAACSSPAPEPQPVAAPTLAPGRAEYAKAKEAIWVHDHRSAVDLLAQAARLDPQVCEYWYQLGAAEANLAIDIVYQSSAEAVRLYESSVDHKTEALRLMKLGKCPIWTDDERAQAQRDAEAGLADAEAVLRDKVSLVTARQMYADQRTSK